MDDCIFCKIASGRMGTQMLYDDDLCVIFNDINPKSKTHLLVVSKKHIATIADMQEGDEKIIGHMIREAKNVAAHMGLKGYKLQFNVGKDGGQEIFHVHLHLMSNF